MNYAQYTVNDFLLDDSFKSWVVHPLPETDAFWQRWLAEHPEKSREVDEAKALILAMDFRQYAPSEPEYQADWAALNQRMDAVESPPVGSETRQSPRIGQRHRIANVFGYWRSIAATVAAIFLVGAGYWLYEMTAQTTISTGYGQTQKIVLSDQSVVTLNANSSIHFKKDWANQAHREVWLEGEAFFEVVHTANHQKFVVHTDQRLDVEVLGTQFNVYQRKSGTRVVLNSGKVKLNIRQGAQSQQVLMQPGEMVQLNESPQGYTKKIVQPQQFSYWLNHDWVFKNTKVREIAALLEDTYGLKMVVLDSTLLERAISGKVSSNKVEDLLFALSQSLNCTVTQQENQLILQPKE